ncbi:MAG: hypothetical protein PVF27_00790 [Gemmatimonadales bacterium]|jgi:hypothetical protein
MVADQSRVWTDARGGTRKGCLFSLLLMAFIAYYGVNLGTHYVDYWKLKDAMVAEASRAAGRTDQVIRRRLVAKIDELELPDDARSSLTIRRSTRPREIRIEASYPIVLELPFYSYVHTFRPRARQPL